MEIVEHSAEFLADIIDLVVVALFAIWLLIITFLAVRADITGRAPSKITTDIRLGLAPLILLALELLIISDILHSIASRTLEDLAIVGGLVVIRVAMAYFLDREIRHLQDLEAERSKAEPKS